MSPGFSEKKFSMMLSQVFDRIATLESKSKLTLYDEIGYALGRSGGSAIQYWIYNHKIPSKLSELELLVELINDRQGWLHWQEIEDFLMVSGHPNAQQIAKRYVNQPGFIQELAQQGSPFVVGPPIFEPINFFGRTKEIQRVFMALQGSVLQHSAIIGKPRSGKTSLLHYLRKITQTPINQLRPHQKSNWLPLPDRYQWVFVDFQDPRMGTIEGFFRYLIHQLGFIQPQESHLSVFVDTLAKKIHLPTVILLDEIQAAFMIPGLDKQFWWALRSLSTNLTEGKLAFVITSQKSLGDIVLDDGLPSPFLNIFGHVMNLGPFTEEESEQFLQDAPIELTQEEINWILLTSQRWPALMQILCNLKYEADSEVSISDWKTVGVERLKPYQKLLD